MKPAISNDAGFLLWLRLTSREQQRHQAPQEKPMLSKFRRWGVAALAAAAALASCGAPALARQPQVIQVPAKAAKPGNRGLFNDLVLPTTDSLYGRKGAGMTTARHKRISAKKRRVARNRANHR